MESGHSVDILTGKPTYEKSADQKEAEEKRILEEKAKFFRIFETNEGQLVVSEIERLLVSRIFRLIDADPEAKAYQNILNTLGYKANVGLKAARSLVLRLNRKEEVA
jgi:hypothetical protein